MFALGRLLVFGASWLANGLRWLGNWRAGPSCREPVDAPVGAGLFCRLQCTTRAAVRVWNAHATRDRTHERGCVRVGPRCVCVFVEAHCVPDARDLTARRSGRSDAMEI